MTTGTILSLPNFARRLEDPTNVAEGGKAIFDYMNITNQNWEDVPQIAHEMYQGAYKAAIEAVILKMSMEKNT